MEKRRRNERLERQQKSIRRNVRLNERNVNHKKLRAFKSPTRWCTFALITLHLSFLPWPPSSGVIQPRARSCRENARQSWTHSFLFIPSRFHPWPLLLPPLICILWKRVSPSPRPPSLSPSLSPSLCLSLSFSPSPSASYLVSPLYHLPGRSLTHRNFLPRIDHLQGRALLGIISYVAVEHSRPDMRCVL